MQYLGVSIFPSDPGAFITGFFGVVTDNIGYVLGIFAAMAGLYFVRRLLNRSVKGKV